MPIIQMTTYKISGGGGGWQPGANTMLYVPMKVDLLDHSLSPKTITNTGIALDNTMLADMGVGYFRGSSDDGLFFSGVEFGNNDFTISRRENTLGNQSSKGARFSSSYDGGSSRAGLLMGYGRTDLYAGTGGAARDIVGGAQVFSSTANTRVHRALTREGSNWKTYRNNVLFGSATGTGSVGYGTEVIGNYRPGDKTPFYGYMSDFIIENKTRTVQEISNYYNQTKGNYGIS